MNILRSFIYILIGLIFILGVVKFTAISNEKIETVYGDDGEVYHRDKYTEITGILRMGDGEYQKDEQQKEMLSVGLIYGGSIIALFLFTFALKNKEDFEKELSSTNIIEAASPKMPLQQSSVKDVKPINQDSRGLVQSGKQYQELAKTANACYLVLQDVKLAIKNGNLGSDHLFYVCYMFRTDILDRIDKYKWSLGTPIVVPMMPGENKTLQTTINILLQNINTCAEMTSTEEECQEILEKDDFYYELEERIPPHAKSTFV